MKIAGVISSFAFALVIASAGADSAPEPFFEGLGSHTRKISTDVPETQKYFDQGFDFLFGFNHGAAIRAFQAAEQADPTCAMAQLGNRACVRAAYQLPARTALSGRTGMEGTRISPGKRVTRVGSGEGAHRGAGPSLC